MPGLRIQIDTSAAQRASAQLRSELSRLGSSASTNEQEFRRLEQRLISGMGTAGAQRSLDSLQRSLNMTRIETARFRASLGDFGGAFSSLSSGFGGAMQRMTSGVFNLRNALLGIAGLAVFKTIIQQGMAFEDTMLTVKAVARATTEEYQQLEAAARKMGEETEWTAKQSAEALKYMAMAGFSAKDAIATLPGMLDLATAAQMDLGRATDISTDIMTAFGLQTTEITRLNDAFINVSTRANTTVSMMGDSMKYVAPVAAQMGYSIEETAAMIGVLANAGIKGEQAGTNLRQALLRTGEAAKSLGMDVGSSLLDVLAEMAKRQYTANEMTEEFGIIASTTAMVLSNNVKAVQELTKAQIDNQGAAQAMAEEMRGSISKTLDVLISTVESLTLSFFDLYGSDLKSAIQGVNTSLLENKDSILEFAGSFIDFSGNVVDFIKQDLPGHIEKIVDNAQSFITLIDSFGADNLAWGVVGYFLFGPQGAAVLYLISNATNKINELRSAMDIKPVSIGDWFSDLGSKLTPDWVDDFKSVFGINDELPAVVETQKQAIQTLANAKISAATSLAKALDEINQKQVVSDKKTLQQQAEAAKKQGNTAQRQAAAKRLLAEESSKQAAAEQKRIEKQAASASLAASKQAASEQTRIAKQAAEERARILEQFSTDFQKATLSDADYQQIQLDNQLKKYEKHVSDKTALNEWYAAEFKKIEDSRLDDAESALKDYFSEIDDLDKDLTDKARDEAEQRARDLEDALEDQRQAYEDFVADVQRSTSDIFMSLFDGGFSSFFDEMENMFKRTLSNMAAQAIAEPIIVPVIQSIGSVLGSTISSSLGIAGSTATGTGFNISNISSIYSAISGGLETGVYNALTSGVLGNIGSGLFGSAWTGAAGAELGWGATAAATTGMGTSGIASAIASVAPWASMVALAVPLVMKLFEDDPEPFLRVQTTSTSQELSDPNYQWANGEGVSPAGFDYNLTLQDIDSSESREALYQAITAMLDAQFTAIEDTLNVSVNDAIVAAQNAGGGYGEGFFSKIDLAGYEDDLEGALSALSEDLFKDIRGFLVEQLAGEAGSVFNADFFDSIALADEGAIDTFLRFGSVVESTDDFMGQFTRQMEEYGETATQAFENVQTITTIMDALSTSAQDFSDNSAISTLEAINEAYAVLTETLEGANATIEDLAATEQYRLQELGAAVTGLTATSLGTMLWDSISNEQDAATFVASLESQIRAGVGQAVVNTFSETLYSALLAPINSSIGSMVSSIITGGVLTGEALQAGISGIVDQLDATAAVLNDPAIITAIQELMNSVTTITTMSGAEETGTTTTTDATNPIDAMNAYNSTSGFYDAVESASEEAATSIEDLTEEISSFNTAISDIIAENSMDEYGYNIYKIDHWYEEQKTTAEELGIALDDLNTAYDLQKKKIEEARQDAIDEFKDSVASVIAENTLNDYALSLRELNSWYDEQKAKADELGVSLDDLNTAYDLQKSALDNDLISQYNELTETFVSALNPLNDYQTQQAEIVNKYGEIADIFSEYGILIDANGNLTDIAATGLAAMNAELDNLRASMIGTIQAIQATITGTSDEQTIKSLAGNLGFDESYSSTLLTSFGQQAFLDAIAGMDASVIADYLDSVAADPETLESLVSMFLGLQTAAAEEAATRAQNIADFSSSIDDIIADNTLGDYANQLREIDLWYADQLVTANDLGVAMDNLNLAYQLQIQAVEDARQAEIDALTSSFSDLIAESTLSDYEKSLRSLSQWYEEQYETVVALGMPLDLLNAAYDAQKEAIEATEAQRLADELASLAEEMAALQEKISDFNTAIDDTIAENTLSDLELSLRTINQWYAEQKAMAQELGIALDDLNYAYDLQIKAAHTAAVDAARSAYQSAVSSALSDAQEKQTALESAYASAKSTYISVLQQELSAQAQVTAEIESTIETFSGFVESLQDARDSLARSESSGGSPDQIYAESSNQLDALMKDIWSGETDKMAAAMENLPGLGSDFLSASKSRTADYQEYLRDVAKVQSYLSTAQDIASSQKSTEELALEQSESQTNNLQSILDSLDDQLPSLADAQEAYYASQLELNNSQYQSQIDYYTAELERLDLLINGTNSVASALESYQAALKSAISAGDSSYNSELDALNDATTNTGGNTSTGGTTDTGGNTSTGGTTDNISDSVTFSDLLSMGWGVQPSGSDAVYWLKDSQGETVSSIAKSTLFNSEKLSAWLPKYASEYGFATGGTVTGSDSGYFLPTTFHGTEHITPDSQMQGVKDVLKEIKEVLEMMMNTGGENYQLAKKIHRIIDDSSKGKATINTKVAA